MIELLDRSRLRKLDLPRAFMQDMLLPFRGRSGATYCASWGEKDLENRRRFEVTLRSFERVEKLQGRGERPRKNGQPRASRKLDRTLGPEHADVLVALFLIQQASADSADLIGVSFQQIWRAMHAFSGRCGNYSGAWRKKVTRAIDELGRCDMSFVDRGAANERRSHEYPIQQSGPVLRVFWADKQCRVAGREILTKAIERIIWGPAIEHMMAERLTLTFRADEYFGIPSGPGRIAYLFAPAPAAARARDVQAKHADGAPPSDFSQSSSTLLLKLGYAPEELADRYRRHRLLVPLQHALDCRSLSNGHLCVSVTRHQPPDRPRHDWRLSIRVSDRRPVGSSTVEDVTFVAAQEGGRTKSELFSALRRIPELDTREEQSIAVIWPEAARARAVAWARKAKAFLLAEDRPVFAEILAEVKMLKTEGKPFRKAPAAMAVGLVHNLLRTHTWPMPGRRTPSSSPPG